MVDFLRLPLIRAGERHSRSHTHWISLPLLPLFLIEFSAIHSAFFYFVFFAPHQFSSSRGRRDGGGSKRKNIFNPLSLILFLLFFSISPLESLESEKDPIFMHICSPFRHSSHFSIFTINLASDFVSLFTFHTVPRFRTIKIVPRVAIGESPHVRLTSKKSIPISQSKENHTHSTKLSNKVQFSPPERRNHTDIK